MFLDDGIVEFCKSRVPMACTSFVLAFRFSGSILAENMFCEIIPKLGTACSPFLETSLLPPFKQDIFSCKALEKQKSRSSLIDRRFLFSRHWNVSRHCFEI